MVKYTAAQKRAYAKRMKGKKGSAQSKFKLPRPKGSVVKNLAPILETKKFSNGGAITVENLAIDSAALVIIPSSFCYMNRERDVTGPAKDSAMNGRDVFSRFLTMKIEVTYPHGANGPPVPCRPIELIWGWCNPLNLTEFTTPKAGEATVDDIVTHITNSVSTEYNDIDDPLLFPDKKKRLYNIVGKKTVMPNLNRQLPHAIPAGSWADSAMPLLYSLSWPTQKKVRYQHSIPGYLQDNFSYPNEGYVPFVIAYNQDFGHYRINEEEEVRQIALRISSCHWFTDG